MVGRLLSFWEGLFSGAMLNFQGVLVYPKSTVNHRQFGQIECSKKNPTGPKKNWYVSVLADLRILNLCISKACLVIQLFTTWICPAASGIRLVKSIFSWFIDQWFIPREVSRYSLQGVKEGVNYLSTGGFFHQQYYSVHVRTNWFVAMSNFNGSQLTIYCRLTLGPGTCILTFQK